MFRFVRSTLIVFIFLIIGYSIAYSFWTPVSTLCCEDVRAMAADRDSTAWCLGGWEIYHWNRLNNHWDSVATDVNTHNDIFVLRNGTLIISNYGPTYLRSTNRGLTWDSSGCCSLGQYSSNFVQWGDTLFAASDTIKKSTNGGVTWAVCGPALDTLSPYRIEDGHGGRFIVIEMEEDDELNSFYLLLSGDGGRTWCQHEDLFWGDACVFVNDSTVLIQQPNNDSLYIASPLTAPWRSVGLLNDPINRFYWDGDSVLYALTSGGIYRKSDTGYNWTLSHTFFDASACVRLSSGEFLASSRELGCCILSRGSEHLTMNNGFPVTHLEDVTCRGDNEIFVTSDYEANYHSTDNGLTWRATGFRDTPLLTTPTGTVIAGAHYLPPGDSVWHLSSSAPYYFGDCGTVTESGICYIVPYGFANIVSSSNNGQSWQQRILVPHTFGITMIAAFDNGTLLGGSSDSLRILYPGDSVFHSQSFVTARISLWNDSIAYACMTDRSQSLYPSLYSSNDHGQSWQMLRQYLRGYVFVTPNHNIYVGGTLCSYDNGMTFDTISQIEPFMSYINKFAIQGSNGSIYLATTMGLYRSEYPDDIKEPKKNLSLPGKFMLRNYPNPFNPTTTIEYSIPKTSKVELKLFDVTGREVGTLVNFNQNPGTYRVKLDASKLASGIYFYRLKAGNFSSTKKLSVVK